MYEFKLIEASEDDIRVNGVFNGISMTPERHEANAISDYMQFMAGVDEEFYEYAVANPHLEQDIREDVLAFKAGYVRKLNRYYAVKSRVVSQMISGRGGWSRIARQQEKAHESERKRMKELNDYTDKMLKKLRRRFDPSLIKNASIRSEDEDAIIRLEEKVAELERWHETMKAVNKIVRSKRLNEQEKIQRLIDDFGIKEAQAHNLVLPPVDYIKPGFQSFQLSNNRARIRQAQKRIVELKRRQKISDKETEYGSITVEEAVRDNRVRIYFPGKPEADVRSRLKHNGFRWSPTVGAWQAYYNAYSVQFAHSLAGEFQNE